jgi:HTH-type transcriptional regulator/antitoxin HigA
MGRTRDTTSSRAVYGQKEDRYLELVRRFPLRPLQNDADLEAAIEVVNSLIDQNRRSKPEEDYLDVLGNLVEAYEDEHIPIEPADDAELLRLLIEAKKVTQTQVAKATGIVESTISEVLSGKRKLNRKQIGKLARYFRVSPEAFSFAD